MIRISDVPLPPFSAGQLLALQQRVDAIGSFAQRVVEGASLFERQNRSTNGTFQEVRSTLAGMCQGAARCMYCEDSNAGEIEHFRPKCFFPNLVFVWLNYLYACGPCNRAKLNHFRILLTNGQYVDLRRSPRAVPVEPERGDIVLLDPRSEDPLDYLALDLIQTFHFVPKHPRGTGQHARADYTILRMKLNARDFLPVARREAYGNYRARLVEYLSVRGQPIAAGFAAAMATCGHPTVWAEMKRQATLLPDLARLFEAAPEALTW